MLLLNLQHEEVLNIPASVHVHYVISYCIVVQENNRKSLLMVYTMLLSSGGKEEGGKVRNQYTNFTVPVVK